MGLLSIFGKISLDSSGFNKGIQNVERSADKFSSKLTKQVGGALLGAFSINAVMGFGKELLKRAEEIDKLANRFNLTTDQVQLLQKEAEKTGKTFEEMVKDAGDLEDTLARISGGDVALGRGQLEQLNNARQVINEFKTQAGIRFANLLGLGGGDTPLSDRQNAFLEADAAKKRGGAEDFKNRLQAAQTHMAVQDELLKNEKELEQLKFDQLTKEEKINALLKKRAELWDWRSKQPVTEEGIVANELTATKIDMAIAALRSEKVKDTSSDRLSPLSDSLRSVGNFLGGDPNSGVVQKLSNIERQLNEIRRNTGRQSVEGGRFPL